MKRKRILSCTLLLLSSLSFSTQLFAQLTQVKSVDPAHATIERIATADTLRADSTLSAEAINGELLSNASEKVIEKATEKAVETKETKKEKAEKVSKVKKNGFFQGISISADVFGLVGRAFGNDFDSYEVAAELNLKNKFFPVVEVGYGTTDETDDDKDIHYKVAAPYFRVGCNYNFMHKKQTPNYVYGGLRVGFSTFSYDVDAPALVDPVWGGSVPFEYNGVSSNATWAEFVVGLRAQIVKNFHMGWSLRYKRRLSVKDSPNTEAWYIPGFGINDSAVFGATYNLIFYLPW